jgi:hypothetical protein
VPEHVAYASPEHTDVFVLDWADLPPVNPGDRTLSCGDASAIVDYLRDSLVKGWRGALLGE